MAVIQLFGRRQADVGQAVVVACAGLTGGGRAPLPRVWEGQLEVIDLRGEVSPV